MIFLFIALVSLLTTCIEPRNSCMATSLSNLTDQEALFSIKDYIKGDPNGVLSSWNHSNHFCQWQGVTCSRKRQRVIMLNLPSQQLDGTLSPYIGNLSFLKGVYLQENKFRGSIPERNHFTGSIPPAIGNISSLMLFDISVNNLTGIIPFEVAHLSKLVELHLAGNNLFGAVPLSVYNISSLSTIVLTQNDLEGFLPADLGFTLPNLEDFLAGENKFSGPIPPSMSNASNLVNFDIAVNNITGPLPINFGSLSNLEVLNMGENQLGHNQSPDGLSFLGSLVNSTRLEVLGLPENGLSGELPNSISNLSTTLESLRLNGNYIYGSIPQEIGKLWNLTELILAENMLTGTIPESICKLTKLASLLSSENNISGTIPACLSNITELLTVSLSNNKLHGSIPTTLFNISSIEGLYLFNNHLSGLIPEHITGLSSNCHVLYLDQNLLTGPLPSNIGSLIHLVELGFSDNKMTGEIPTSLGDCLMLEELDMERNLFQGRIPSSFKALRSLKLLDLSDNNMSGNIPHFLGEFRSLRFLNLSHNKFGGEVPKNGVFSNVSAFSVAGNFQLCGGIQALQLHTCPPNTSKMNKKKFSVRLILIIVLLPLAALLACSTIIIKLSGKSKQNNVGTLVLKEDDYPRVSYQELLLATTEFSPNNLLGEGRYGSVYKGILESLNQIAAVKVLKIEVHGANKSFLAECEMLKNIRHRNLIKIITVCSSTDFKGNDFKALVFEFMTHGSLDKWLHPSATDQENEKNLTLCQRLNIAIDVALALDYLHHQCHTKIIHCDIKPSNILLDEEFVAHVGDFGLARLFLSNSGDTNGAQSSSTGIRGTVGYVPPEYGMGGTISAEGDVYSYGILLLEIFSGKRPTTSGIDCATNLHDFVRNALPNKVMDVVDPRIILQKEDCDSLEVCFASIFEVGILCSVETPKSRIDIGVAIKKLHIARDWLLRSSSKCE
ncbi:probable LRR receptor-like serine/threonine-protein kinase At3g47570 isoform X2 [Daucus carota subsp. sativus]|uniref:probable LRR receptor-like serine/threonine-protein kinase At3g47570 isoform X2 n=1 Tax=Daucus carota subsp. sativus TaxID=79200 RepID=UPI0007EF9BCA|nr:PREDICTED: probable LRR receptor-like serine/threonine-protein kinase At3g47570 isoform X2 [Daucus carota subsp. sativus]